MIVAAAVALFAPTAGLAGSTVPADPAGPAVTSASADPVAPSVTSAAAHPGNPLVCQLVYHEGTVLPRQICRTEHQWVRARLRQQEDVFRFQLQGLMGISGH